MSKADAQYVFSCLHCPEKFDSLFSISNHHSSKHKNIKFNEEVYKQAIPYGSLNVKEKADIQAAKTLQEKNNMIKSLELELENVRIEL